MEPSFRVLLCAAAALVGLTAACGEDEVASGVALPEGGACGDGYFWAATESGDIAVTVTVEASDRSRSEPTTLDFALPDPAIEVVVLEGDDLPRNFCTDLPDEAAEPRRAQPATAGEGQITFGPAPNGPNAFACGTVTGALALTGLVAEDGTTFAPIKVRSSSIGCYAG